MTCTKEENGSPEEIEIPATLIKEYFFCPRIPYFWYFSSYDQHEFRFMELGKLQEERLIEEFLKKEKAKLIAKKIYGVDEELKVSGKIDAIIEKEGGLYVLEVKAMESKEYPYEGHYFQALAYAKIALSLGYRVRGAIIFYRDGKSYEVLLTRANLEALRSVVRAIRRIFKTGLPHSRADRCGICSYSFFCSGKSHEGH